MNYVVNAKQMKACDNNTTVQFHVPSLVLMERAALTVCEEIEKRINKKALQDKAYKRRKPRILAVCGIGNNGGDGICTGRLLFEKGYDVTLVLLGERNKCSEETKVQIAIAESYGMILNSKMPETEYDIMIDAIFGIGLSRNIAGFYAKVIKQINDSNCFVIAVDIPSGIHTDTGEVMGIAVKADITVTFAFRKIGQLLHPGTDYIGQLICRDIGILNQSFLGQMPKYFTYEESDLQKLPQRKSDGNKGSFGKLLIIAGSKTMSGACVLSALSAYRCGAGLVRVFTPNENREIIAKTIPEAIVSTYDTEAFDKELLLAYIKQASVVLLGPGLSTADTAVEIVKLCMEQVEVPLVIDADALNILSKHMELLEKRKSENVILTPHMLELSRLSHMELIEIKKNRIAYIKAFAKKYNVTLISKDARTLVADSEGNVYMNTSGNEGMATAGSGDVLAGIVTALLGQKSEPLSAASLAVYIHGLAGDLAKKELGSYSLMAQDIVKYITDILQRSENYETL